jgi:outer membrane biosynthesis protein TonB
MPKREMTIGVTVNLQNYESLRVEVEDDVESEEDVRSLVAFLDQTLALFGRGDAATEKAVNHYRRRVLQGAAGEEAEAPAEAAPKPAAAKPAEAPAPEPPAHAPETPEPVALERPEEAPAPKPAAKPPAKAPAKAPAPSPTGAVCEECGAPVSAAEEKTSRLFVSRTLCKKCIQSL